MAITFPASYSSVQGDGGNNGLAITTGTEPDADDVLVVGMCVNANGDTITPPGGWTEATVGDNSIATAGGQIRAWYLVDPADSTTYTWTVGTSTRRSIVGVLCRGVDNTTPVDVKGSLQSAPGANHTPPSLTSTVDNVGVVDICGLRQFSPDTANWTVPASGLTWTEQKDVQGADSNNNIRLALGTAVAGAAGALSTTVWTQSDVNEDSIIIRVALKPAAEAASTPWNPQRSIQTRDYGEVPWLQRDRRDANTVATAANPLASPLDTSWQASGRYWHLYSDVAERDSRAYFYQRSSPAEITAPAAAVQYVTARWPQPRDAGEQPWLQRRANDISLLATAQLENELLGGADLARHTLAAATHTDRRESPQQRLYISDPSFYPQPGVTDPLTLAFGAGGTYWLLYNVASVTVDRREVPQQRRYQSDPVLLTTALLEAPLLGAGDTARHANWFVDRRLVPTQPARPDLPQVDADPLILLGGHLRRHLTPATHADRRRTVPQRERWESQGSPPPAVVKATSTSTVTSGRTSVPSVTAKRTSTSGVT